LPVIAYIPTVIKSVKTPRLLLIMYPASSPAVLEDGSVKLLTKPYLSAILLVTGYEHGTGTGYGTFARRIIEKVCYG
jgi:hypothetical protein